MVEQVNSPTMKHFLVILICIMSLNTALGQGNDTQVLDNPLQQILNKTVDNKQVFGGTFALKRENYLWTGTAGNFHKNQPFFIASTTKLFTTALIMQLRFKGNLNLDDPINKYLPSDIMQGLHRYKGQEYSDKITVQHLLAHTSGLPDYFQDMGPSGKSLEDELKQGKDQYWDLNGALERAKKMDAYFPPGTKDKAHYSDLNFQLLAKIIEVVSGKTYLAMCEEAIIQPLQLAHTYLYTDSTDHRPQPLYYKAQVLAIPKAMTSFGADGGMVSNTEDLLAFTEAFFTGKLFPQGYLAEMQVWNRIFSPMQSGVGIHLFKLPWIFNPMGAVPAFIGHSGLSGALAYYVPSKHMYIVGTVNQIDKPSLSFRTMIKLSLAMLKLTK